jgi:hypothetical protein
MRYVTHPVFTGSILNGREIAVPVMSTPALKSYLICG